MTGEPRPADVLAEHLRDCMKAAAAIVVDGNADEIIARLLGAGWTLNEGHEILGGKRIRTLIPPKDVTS